MWLLHGCCDSYRSWTRSTDLERVAELRDVLVVMPEAGDVGFYSDWYNGGRDGAPRWEAFHLTELRRLLERHWRAGDRRVVAGVSMGGLGAMAYAARHRGMFRAAASYSGMLHTRYEGAPISGPRLIQSLLRAFDEDPSALWGEPGEARRPLGGARPLRARAPAARAGPVRVGRQRKARRPSTSARARRLERALLPENVAFVGRLRRSDIPVQFDAYGPGVHDWPYWQRELRRSLPLLLRGLRRQGEPAGA